MSRILSFDYETTIEFDSPVTEHSFLLRCIPADFPGQRILECELVTFPMAELVHQKDGFGNNIQLGRLDGAHSVFSYRTRGRAELSDELCTEPAAPYYRYPSKYTSVSAEMAELIRNTELPADEMKRAERIMELTHDRMSYVPGSTALTTTAADAFRSGRGVCQDYAHIFLALSRFAGLTVRYVNGLREGLSASHAWCEVCAGGAWHGIDPTEKQWTDESYIRFGVGRDYSDCPIERGVFSGTAAQKQTVSIICAAE